MEKLEKRILNGNLKNAPLNSLYNMEPLLTQITDTFPDIQPADIHRIMDFLGYSQEDIFNPDPQYRLINGESIFIQDCIVKDDIERENLRMLDTPETHIEITVKINGDPVEVVAHILQPTSA